MKTVLIILSIPILTYLFSILSEIIINKLTQYFKSNEKQKIKTR